MQVVCHAFPHGCVMALCQTPEKEFMPIGSHLIHDIYEIIQPCEDLLTDAGVDLADAVDQLCMMSMSRI